MEIKKNVSDSSTRSPTLRAVFSWESNMDKDTFSQEIKRRKNLLRPDKKSLTGILMSDASTASEI